MRHVVDAQPLPNLHTHSAHHTVARCWSSFPGQSHLACSSSFSSMTRGGTIPRVERAAPHSDLHPRPAQRGNACAHPIQYNVFQNLSWGYTPAITGGPRQPKVGHASFLGPLSHSQIRAVAFLPPFPVKRMRTGQPNTRTSWFWIDPSTSHTLIGWTSTQRSRIRVPVH